MHEMRTVTTAVDERGIPERELVRCDTCDLEVVWNVETGAVRVAVNHARALQIGEGEDVPHRYVHSSDGFAITAEWTVRLT